MGDLRGPKEDDDIQSPYLLLYFTRGEAVGDMELVWHGYGITHYRWEMKDRELSFMGECHQGRFNSEIEEIEIARALSPDRWLLAVLSSRHLRIWNWAVGISDVRDVDLDRLPMFRRVYYTPDGDEADGCMEWLDERFLAIGSTRSPVVLFDADSAKPIGCLGGRRSRR